MAEERVREGSIHQNDPDTLSTPKPKPKESRTARASIGWYSVARIGVPPPAQTDCRHNKQQRPESLRSTSHTPGEECIGRLRNEPATVISQNQTEMLHRKSCNEPHSEQFGPRQQNIRARPLAIQQNDGSMQQGRQQPKVHSRRFLSLMAKAANTKHRATPEHTGGQRRQTNGSILANQIEPELRLQRCLQTTDGPERQRPPIRQSRKT